MNNFQNFSNLTFVRYLGPIERFVSYVGARHSEAFVVCLTCQFPVAIDILQQAINKAISHIPALRYKLSIVAGKLAFVEDRSTEVKIRLLHCKSLELAIAELLSERFQLNASPLVRVATLGESLLFCFHHIIADGQSAVSFIAETLKIIQGDSDKRLAQTSKILLHPVEHYLGIKDVPPLLPPPFIRDLTQPQDSYLVDQRTETVILDHFTTRKIITYAQRLNCSVNALITTCITSAYQSALHECLKNNQNIRLILPFNLSSVLNSSLLSPSFGYYLSRIDITLSPRPLEPYDALIIDRQIRKTLIADRGKRFLQATTLLVHGIEQMNNLILPYAKSQTPTLLISFIGDLTKRFQGFKSLDITFDSNSQLPSIQSLFVSGCIVCSQLFIRLQAPSCFPINFSMLTNSLLAFLDKL